MISYVEFKKQNKLAKTNKLAKEKNERERERERPTKKQILNCG